MEDYSTAGLLMKCELFTSAQEGFRQYPYKDSKGIETIAFGRNLHSRGISKKEGYFLLKNDLLESLATAKLIIKDFDSLDFYRRLAIIDMIFNLGETKFLEFKNLIEALNEKKFDVASKEINNSRLSERRKNLLTNIMMENKMYL